MKGRSYQVKGRSVSEHIVGRATREVEQHVSGAGAKMSRVGVEFSRSLCDFGKDQRQPVSSGCLWRAMLASRR